MKISNKTESAQAIKALGLNELPTGIFKKGQTAEVLQFLKQYPAKYYAIRDRANAGGIFKMPVKAEDVLKEIKGYSLFSINISNLNYANSQLLTGEIQIKDDMIYAIGSTNSTYSLRDAYKDPTFNISTNILDDATLSKIPHLDKVIQYILDHGLQGLIVEFSLFDKKVGTKNDYIVVYELRTEY